MELAAIFDGLRGEVIEIPEKIVAVILDAKAETMSLGEVDVALFIEAEGCGRSDFLVLVIGDDFCRDSLGNGHARKHIGGNEASGVGLVALGHGREFLVGVVGENEMVSRDHTPTACFGIDDAYFGFFALEASYIPGDRFTAERVFSRSFHLDLTIDQQLHGGFAGMIATGNKEYDVGLLDGKFCRGQRTECGIALMCRAS